MHQYYVTGNNRGLGLELSKYFQAKGCSRRSGLDITNHEDIVQIAKQSLHYDVFINNAFDGPPDEPWGNFGQFNVLLAVYKEWFSAKKEGWIFNIGSTASNYVYPVNIKGTYGASKTTLDYASKQCSRAFSEGMVNFKTTLIKPGVLDTPLNRMFESWTGNGVNCVDVAKFIEYAISIKRNSIIEEVVIDVNMEYSNE